MLRLPVVEASSPGLRAARGVFALMGFAGVLWQVKVLYDQPDPSVVNFLSFFTIQSNLVISTVLAAGALRPSEARRRELLRGATTLYLLITGCVYALLLSDVGTGDLTAPLVNLALHRVMPIVAIVDWLLAPPASLISRRTAWLWLLYPLAYFAYSMIRGYFVSWYPYPFLHPGLERGYSGVLLNALVVLLLTAALVTLVRVAGNARRLTAATP